MRGLKATRRLFLGGLGAAPVIGPDMIQSNIVEKKAMTNTPVPPMWYESLGVPKDKSHVMSTIEESWVAFQAQEHREALYKEFNVRSTLPYDLEPLKSVSPAYKKMKSMIYGTPQYEANTIKIRLIDRLLCLPTPTRMAVIQALKLRN